MLGCIIQIMKLDFFCWHIYVKWHLEVFFFQKMWFVFQISKSQKKIFQKTILSLKVEFPANNNKMFWAGNLNFKFMIVFWNIFFWRFGGLKNESHFLKKSHLYKWTVYFLGMFGKLCARIVGISDLLTYGKNPSEIMDKQSLNQIKIYTPCADEREFFDGWGG